MNNPKFPKIVAVIACRVNSTRLFGKPLQRIGKYSILERILIQLKQSKMIDEIVLAISEKSENEVFVTFAKENKLKFVPVWHLRTRPLSPSLNPSDGSVSSCAGQQPLHQSLG